MIGAKPRRREEKIRRGENDRKDGWPSSMDRNPSMFRTAVSGSPIDGLVSEQVDGLVRDAGAPEIEVRSFLFASLRLSAHPLKAAGEPARPKPSQSVGRARRART